MLITILMDNTRGTDHTVPEHGLSFFIETENTSLIFDTGQSGDFCSNAEVLNKDLSKSAFLVLSHSHYDHGGGVKALFEKTDFNGELWVGTGFFDSKWSEKEGEITYAGLNFDRDYLKGRTQLSVLNTVADGPQYVQLCPGIYVLGGFNRTHSEEKNNPRFMIDRAAKRETDDFRDEICLVIPSPSGLIVLLGCAHPGLMNMLDAAKQCFNTGIYAVLGGSHLVEADEERLKASINYLKQERCTLAALGHCTGEKAMQALEHNLDSYKRLCTGFSLEL